MYKRQVSKALIVRTKKEIRRADGSYIRFDDNACVLLNNAGEIRGSRIFGTCLRQQDRTQRLTRRNTGRFGRGVVSLPSERFARFGNPARPGLKTANFAAFGSWPGVFPENAESLRNSDALMRVAVPRRRGPAGLRRPTPPAERTVLAPISPRVQLCLRRPAFPLSAFIPGA